MKSITHRREKWTKRRRRLNYNGEETEDEDEKAEQRQIYLDMKRTKR